MRGHAWQALPPVTFSLSRIAPQGAAQEFSVSIAAGAPDTCPAIGQHAS